MKTIILEPLQVNGKLHIAIRFTYDAELVGLMHEIPGCKWSRSEKCWRLDYSPEKLESLKYYFAGKAMVDDRAFRKPVEIIHPVKAQSRVPVVLSKLNQFKISKFRSWLSHRRYSERTIENYVTLASVFLSYFNDIPVEDISGEDIIIFNNEYIIKHKYSIPYQRQIVSALKLFFSQVENRRIDPEKLERPRVERSLPSVFSKEEVEAILCSLRNLKHKAILSVIYSAGLRIGELINLKISDIDSHRMVIHIRQAKGRKDRMVTLSSKIVVLLRQYYQAYKPKEYLFEGVGFRPYSNSSCRSILKRAMKAAGIRKPGSLHTLRHSYATHLLESGTDIRFIQELLGHKSSRTTEIYTHVSKKKLEEIKSPFDELELS